MSNIFDENKARKLDSISVARYFCFTLTDTNLHDKIFPPPHCFCFHCRIKDLLKEILIERNEQVLFVINVNNFNELDDIVIFKKLLLMEKL